MLTCVASHKVSGVNEVISGLRTRVHLQMREQNNCRFQLQRRTVLLGALASTLVPCGNAIAAATNYPELSLKLYNLHTTEEVDTVFWADGQYNQQALNDLNHLLRDHRTDQMIDIDVKLFSLLYLINSKLGNSRSISVISGYRSKETNRKLALTNPGVATNSYHTKGQAIDIRISGRETKDIRNAGLQLRVGGVGYYKRSNFTHLDTGPHRRW